MLMQAAIPMTDTITIPGYSIVRKLGQGGMASVYLAVQHSFEREVALKVMSPLLNSDPSFAARFKREARIVAQLSHASIVPVFEVGEHQSCHYLSMEYLSGGDLKRRILDGERDLALALNVCTALSGALDTAHRKGFVHRDIKPENILFREDGTPVLTDFGIARALDSGRSMTVAGMLVGTPDYMSPEQVKGLELDGRGDLYSLGIVFYEILTGAVPFKADSTLSVALKQVGEPLPALPPEQSAYQEFLDCLTAKDREERFASGAEVVRALRVIGSERNVRNRAPLRPQPVNETPTAEQPYESQPTLARPRIVTSVTPVETPTPTPVAQPTWFQKLASRTQPFWMTIAAIVALAVGVALIAGGLNSPHRASSTTASTHPLPPSTQPDPLTTPAPSTPAVTAPPAPAAAPRPRATLSDTAPRAALANTSPPAPAAGTAPHVPTAGTSSLVPAAGTTSGATAANTPPPALAASTPPPAPATVTASRAPLANTPTPGSPPLAQESTSTAGTAPLSRRKRLEEQRRQRKQDEAQMLAQHAAELHAAQMQAQETHVQELLLSAKSELASGALWHPAGANAADHYREVLRLQPTQPEALAGAQRVANVLAAEAAQSESVGDVYNTRLLLEQVQSLQPDHPKLADLQARLEQLQSAPTSPDTRDRERLDRAAKYMTRMEQDLGRNPLDYRAVDAATDDYDRALSAASMAPGLPSLRERLIDAYATAVRTEMDNHDPKHAQKLITTAHKRKWTSDELDQLETGLKASAAPTATTAPIKEAGASEAAR
jgi:serine/threonine protein kinase